MNSRENVVGEDVDHQHQQHQQTKKGGGGRRRYADIISVENRLLFDQLISTWVKDSRLVVDRRDDNCKYERILQCALTLLARAVFTKDSVSKLLSELYKTSKLHPNAAINNNINEVALYFAPLANNITFLHKFLWKSHLVESYNYHEIINFYFDRKDNVAKCLCISLIRRLIGLGYHKNKHYLQVLTGITSDPKYVLNLPNFILAVSSSGGDDSSKRSVAFKKYYVDDRTSYQVHKQHDIIYVSNIDDIKRYEHNFLVTYSIDKDEDEEEREEETATTATTTEEVKIKKNKNKNKNKNKKKKKDTVAVVDVDVDVDVAVDEDAFFFKYDTMLKVKDSIIRIQNNSMSAFEKTVCSSLWLLAHVICKHGEIKNKDDFYKVTNMGRCDKGRRLKSQISSKVSFIHDDGVVTKPPLPQNLMNIIRIDHIAEKLPLVESYKFYNNMTDTIETAQEKLKKKNAVPALPPALASLCNSLSMLSIKEEGGRILPPTPPPPPPPSNNYYNYDPEVLDTTRCLLEMGYLNNASDSSVKSPLQILTGLLFSPSSSSTSGINVDVDSGGGIRNLVSYRVFVVPKERIKNLRKAKHTSSKDLYLTMEEFSNMSIICDSLAVFDIEHKQWTFWNRTKGKMEL